ncbi:hypothetical protein GPECTOR_35g874 [Gonium pectorale]|uniref:Uncharacterized protein n=1 Tax=Gonium pectorale TaxID=33097 RepID=A0A150GC55_GONPE|nr:hypothetical protein GPECTOR_35g874 [Gonium pectorale]|eukprot:KXZ47436.1 hypothetical protein GPECTOR_35g874 [Gonium pectorale]
MPAPSSAAPPPPPARWDSGPPPEVDASPSKVQPTSFVVLQDAPIPFGASSAGPFGASSAGPFGAPPPRGASNSGAAPPKRADSSSTWLPSDGGAAPAAVDTGRRPSWLSYSAALEPQQPVEAPQPPVPEPTAARAQEASAAPAAGPTSYDHLSDIYLATPTTTAGTTAGAPTSAFTATDAAATTEPAAPVPGEPAPPTAPRSEAPPPSAAAAAVDVPPLPVSFGVSSPGTTGTESAAAPLPPPVGSAWGSAAQQEQAAPAPAAATAAAPARATSRFAWLFGSPPPPRPQPEKEPQQRSSAAAAAAGSELPPIMTQPRAGGPAPDPSEPSTAPAAVPGGGHSVQPASAFFSPPPPAPAPLSQGGPSASVAPPVWPSAAPAADSRHQADASSAAPFATDLATPTASTGTRGLAASRLLDGPAEAEAHAEAAAAERAHSQALGQEVSIGVTVADSEPPSASAPHAPRLFPTGAAGAAQEYDRLGTGPAAGLGPGSSSESGLGSLGGSYGPSSALGASNGPFEQRSRSDPWVTGSAAASAPGERGAGLGPRTDASRGPFGDEAGAAAVVGDATTGGGALDAGNGLPSFLRDLSVAGPSDTAQVGRRFTGELSFGGAPPAAEEPVRPGDFASAPSFSTSYPPLPPPAAPIAPSQPLGLPPLPPPPPAVQSGNGFATTASYLSAYSAVHSSAPAHATTAGAVAAQSYLDSYLDNLLSTMSAEKADAAAVNSGAGAGGSVAPIAPHSAPGVSAAASRRTSHAGHDAYPDEASPTGSSGEDAHGNDHDAALAADGDASVHGGGGAAAAAAGSHGGAGEGAGRRPGGLPHQDSILNLRGHLSRRQSTDSVDVVSVYSHTTGHTHGPGGGSGGSRAQFAALQQHIDELTEEKMALSRGLQQQVRINEQMVEENEALTVQYNARGAAMEELERKLKRYEQELAAQALTLEGFSEERQAAKLSYAEASSRAQALASEVVGLEAQVLQLKSAVLKAERTAEEATQRQRKLEKQVATLTAEAAARAQELQQTQLKGRNLVVKLKQTEAKLEAAEEKLAAMGAGGRLPNGHHAPHTAFAPAALPTAAPAPVHKPETAEQEVQCNLAAELPHPPAATAVLPFASDGGAAATANGGSSHTPHHHLRTGSIGSAAGGAAAASAAVPDSDADDGLPSAAATGRELALVPRRASFSGDGAAARSGGGGGGGQLVDWESARPLRDPPSAVAAERALASLETGALLRGGAPGGLPEGLGGVAAQLARWLPAGPISGGDPVALMAEEELRLMQSIHGLLGEFEAAQEAAAAGARELQARVEALAAENDDLRGKLSLQTQRLELLMAGGLASGLALPAGALPSLHQTPQQHGSAQPTGGSSVTLSLAAMTPHSHASSYQPSVAAGPGPAAPLPGPLAAASAATPTRSTRQASGSSSLDSPTVGRAGALGPFGAAPSPGPKQSWMGYLFRPRQNNKKRVRTAIL